MATLRRVIFSSIIISLLTACASEPKYYQPIADEQISKPDKNGVIFLRVAHAFPGLRENTLILQALNADKTISVISALDDDGEYSSSFLASLPPGNYTIARLGEHSQYFQNDIVLKQSVGSFTVRAGGFTNLGTLIIGKDVVMRSGEEAPIPKIWQSQFPNLYRQLASSNSTGWNTPTTNMVTWEQLADHFPPMYRGFIDAGDNQLMSLGTLGIIRTRSTQGNWQTISLHNTAHALGYARNNSGMEFAALEYRQFFLRAAGSSSWKAIAAPDDRGKVVYTKFAKNGQLYLVINEEDGTAKIYSTTLDVVQWRLVGNIGITSPTDVFDMIPGNKRVKITPRVSVAGGTNDNIFIMQIGFGTLFSHDALQLTRFDFNGNIMQPLTPPFSSKHVMDITITNGIASIREQYYEERQLYKSSDNGLNWQSIAYDAKKDGQAMALTSAVKFIDTNIGFAVFNGSSLMRTDDGGYHWTMVNLPTKPHQVPAPVSLITGGSSNELLIAREGHYEISRDQGQSWQVER